MKSTISCGKKSQRYLSGIAGQKTSLKVATGSLEMLFIKYNATNAKEA